jgi:hypothetical protein
MAGNTWDRDTSKGSPINETGPVAALVKYRGDFRSQKSVEFVMSCVTISFSRITRIELHISFRSFIMCSVKQVLPTPLTPVFVNYT